MPRRFAVAARVEWQTRSGADIVARVLLLHAKVRRLSAELRGDDAGTAGLAFDMRPVPRLYPDIDAGAAREPTDWSQFADGIRLMGSPVEIMGAGGTFTLMEKPVAAGTVNPSPVRVTLVP